ncbi:hypothetical protein KCU83_g5379, partial [Aureobasidium melanogenum]
MSPKRSLRSAEQRSRVLRDGRKSQLAYEFCVQLVEGLLNSNEPYSNLFRKPLSPQADGIVVRSARSKVPIGLENLLERLKSKEVIHCAEVKKYFDELFNYRARYYPETSQTFIQGSFLKEAFNEVWAKREEWIQEQAKRENQSPKPAESSRSPENNDVDHASDETVHVTSDDETDSNDEETSSIYEETNSSDGETSFNDEETRPNYEETNLNYDESSDDNTMEAINQTNTDDSEDERTSENDLSGRRGSSIFQANGIEEDGPSKKSEHESKGQKSMTVKLKIGHENAERLENGRRIAAGDLNVKNKRPLDIGSITETSTLSSPQQQDSVPEQPAEEQIDISTQDHELSAEQGPAKRPRLEPSAESVFESPPQSPTQQQRTQQPVIQQPVTQQEVTRQPAGRSQQPTSEERYVSAMMI